MLVVYGVVSDSWDKKTWYIYVVDILDGLDDLSGRLTLGVKRQNFIIKASDAGLILAHQGGSKSAVMVSWGGDMKLIYVTMDGLLVCPLRLSAFSCSWSR